MKILSFVMLLTVFTTLNNAEAQFRGTGWSGGVGFGMIQGITEAKSDARFGGRVFARKGFSDMIALELGAGIYKIGGLDYNTLIYPFDLRVQVSPFNMESVNPYIYAGYGLSRFQNEIKPSNNFPNAVAEGGIGSIPIGAGIAAKLNSNVNFEITGGYDRTTSADLDALRSGTSRDGYWNLMLNLVSTVISGDADSDHDGLTNDQESELGTDPNKADTDGDGLPDGDEVMNYKTNPKVADSDGDGLSDKEEVMTTHTDPNKADTDGDGVSDGDEVTKYKTDPTKSDSDGDGLSDGEEITKYKTDPLKADTDNGTVSDGDEVKRGTDPLKASDDVPPAPKEEPKKEEPKTDIAKIEKGESLSFAGILFESGSATISASSESTLTAVATTLASHPEIEVEVQGHTDNRGKETTNKKLSQRRADAVRTYLVKHGIDKKRITTAGYGSEKPVASNDTDEGRGKNRRIEFLRTK